MEYKNFTTPLSDGTGKDGFPPAPSKADREWPPRVFIHLERLEKALSFCDLGDSISAGIYVFPHKDMLPDLVEVMSVAERDHDVASAIAKTWEEARAEAFEEMAKHFEKDTLVYNWAKARAAEMKNEK